ncbi:MAG: hypothetical protein M3O25_08915 [Actinomycetota bacterium]|nr:hypothetical protein [Actinomycetota bacterium]
MKRIVLIVVAMALSALAVLADGSAQGDYDYSELSSEVKTPSLAPATCSKRLCHVEATCPPEGGGRPNFPVDPNRFGGIVPEDCKFELSLFGKKPLLGLLTRDVFGLDDEGRPSGPSDRRRIPPGATTRTTWPVTPFGRRSIKRALRDGKRKVKGQWTMVAFWNEAYILPSEEFVVETYYGHRTGSVRIKLKGKSSKK